MTIYFQKENRHTKFSFLKAFNPALDFCMIRVEFSHLEFFKTHTVQSLHSFQGKGITIKV